MKAVKNISIWLVIMLYMIVVLGFVGSRIRQENCSLLEVRIMDSLERSFLDPMDIRTHILEGNDKLLGYPMSRINLAGIEIDLEDIPAVRNAEVFTTSDGVLHAEIWQRKPLFRILDRSGQWAYVDEEGYVIPVSEKFTAHCLVANGEVGGLPEKKTNILNMDSGDENIEVLREMYTLSRYIRDHEFWDAQFVQIYYAGSGAYELVPRVGSHLIILGSMDQFEKKLKKLKALYEKGFNNIGWNDYTRINLKFNNQIVCTKRK